MVNLSSSLVHGLSAEGRHMDVAKFSDHSYKIHVHNIANLASDKKAVAHERDKKNGLREASPFSHPDKLFLGIWVSVTDRHTI